jgi:hypothetical protein
MTPIKQGAKFWIVTWEGENSFSKGSKPHVAAILSARKSPKYVIQLTEELYALSLSLEHQMERSRYRNPIVGQTTTRDEGLFTCGDNPFLMARKVSNLTVEEDENGIERAKWDEPSKPKSVS